MDLSRIEISSPRLRLATFTPADVAEVFAAVTPTLTRFTGFEPSPSIEALTAVCADWPRQAVEGRTLHLTVRLAQGGAFVGMAGLHALDRDGPIVGIWIRETEQGRGLGRETVAALARWAGEVLGVAALRYPVADENLASRAIPERLGGTLVGHSQAVKADGRRLNLTTYRIPIPLRSGCGGDESERNA